MTKSFKAVLLVAVLMLSGLGSSSRAASDLDTFETQLDFTIRSACHGYMVDAIPDFLSEVRSWLNKNTPFCQTVRTLGKDESAYELLKQQDTDTDYDNKPKTDIRITTGGYNPARDRHNDCNDWMCQHIRDQVYKEGHPISLADYNKVELYCGSGYGCIENWFKTWPRPLPSPQKSNSGMSLDSLMGNAPTAANPSLSVPKDSGSGMSLDEMMAPSQPAETSSNSGHQISSAEATTTASISLDSALAGGSNNQPKAVDTSLDNVFSGREQLTLEKHLLQINKQNSSLSSSCSCSIEKSGCYKLPAESLLKTANNIELERFQTCGEWQQVRMRDPDNSGQAKIVIQQLTKLKKKVKELDNSMDSHIDDWEQERRRMIAQQKQQQRERESSAYLTGMASILMQSSAVANGTLSTQQAATNAINVSKNVESGQSWGSAMGSTIVSSLPSQIKTNQTAANSNSISGSASASSSQSFVVDETYNYTCSSGTKGSTPIKAKSMVCANAMKRYARTAGCNLYEEQEAAQNAYYSACASEMYE